MALAPADFYAYSNATGIPVPEDPAERAALAPQVIEFRRNQLKSTQSESNPLAALGSAALAVGTLAGLGFGAAKLLGRTKQLPKGPAKSATAGVRQINLADEEILKRAAAGVPTAEPPAPSKTPPTAYGVEEEYVPFRPDPKEMISPSVAEARRVAAREALLRTAASRQEPYQLELPGTQATLNQLRYKGIPEGTELGVVLPEAPSRPLSIAPSQLNLNVQQDIADQLLSKYAEDYKRAAPFQYGTELSRQAAIARRNENLIDDVLREIREQPLDLTTVQQQEAPVLSAQQSTAVNSGTNQVINQAVRQQHIADLRGENLTPETQTVLGPGGQVNLLSSSVEENKKQARTFLASQREKLGYLSPTSRERALAENPAVNEALELYASTGDPSVLSRLSETPSSPLTIRPQVQTELKQEVIPTGKFFQTTPHGEFVDDLVEKDIKLTNRISALGAQQQQINNRLKEIDEAEPMLRFASADEPGQGGYYTRLLNKLTYERQNLPDPSSFNVDIGDALAERDYVRGRIESLESLGPKYQLLQRQEGVRPFYEVDPTTGEPIAETLEIRSGRPSVELEEEKTAGGRVYAMYDPESQVGSSTGVYGIEPRNFPIADPELRPTALQREETKLALRREPARSTPEAKLRSLEVSEALRRAKIEGRDPQVVLRNLGFNV